MKGHRSGGPDFPTQHSTWHLGEAMQGGRGQRGLPSGLDWWSVGDMFYPLWLQVFQHSLSPLPDVMAPVFPAAVSFPEGSQGGPCNHRSDHATLSLASLPLLPGTSGRVQTLQGVTHTFCSPSHAFCPLPTCTLEPEVHSLGGSLNGL